MIHATIPLSHFTRLDERMLDALLSPPGNQPWKRPQHQGLWELCEQAMGIDWCRDYETAPECAAMIVAMALLKQIDVVEDRT